LGRSGQRPELSQATGMALVCCNLGKFLGVACYCFPRSLDFPNFQHVRHEVRDRSGGSGKCGQECKNFAEMRTSTPFKDLLHATNLQHGTDGFTSPPKEGVLRIFSPLKIRWLWPGLKPRTWVLKASTLTPRPPKPLRYGYC